jgi:hypothetical protein
MGTFVPSQQSLKLLSLPFTFFAYAKALVFAEASWMEKPFAVRGQLSATDTTISSATICFSSHLHPDLRKNELPINVQFSLSLRFAPSRFVAAPAVLPPCSSRDLAEDLALDVGKFEPEWIPPLRS